MKSSARRRLAITVPTAALVVGISVQSGAAAACGRWLWGSGDSENSFRSVSTQAGGQNAERRTSAVVAKSLVVADGAELGTVTGRFTLVGGSTLPDDGKVEFSLRGPSKTVLVDGKAPFRMTIDPRRMRLADGDYSVSTRVAGEAADSAVARLTIKTGDSRVTSSPASPAVRAVPSPSATSEPTSSKAAAPDSPTRPNAIASAPSAKQPAAESPASTAPKAKTTTATRTATPTQTAAQKATTAQAPAPVSGNQAAQVVALTNQERVANGCKALTVDSKLTASAQGHSTDMAAKGYFSHTGQDGRSPFDRMKAAGYSYRLAAENIAAGQRTPQAVVTAWMNSSGHRANILNCSLTEIGVGVASGGSYGIYWTQNFGTPR